MSNREEKLGEAVSKHTPYEIKGRFTSGPWNVDPACDSIVGKADKKHGFIHVADVRGYGRLQYLGIPGEEEFLENGRLIASAPEMFNALSDIRDILHEQGGHAGLDAVVLSITGLLERITGENNTGVDKPVE